jgi:hypothetical protein
VACACAVTGRRLDHRGQFVTGVLRLPRIGSLGGESAGGHHLDPIHSPRGPLVHRIDEGLGAIGRTAEEPAMPTGAGQWGPGNQKFRSQRGSPPVFLPQRQGRKVAVTEIANRGDSGAQRGLGVPSCPSQQRLMRVAGQIFRLTVGVPAQMRMRIHQPRQQRRLTQVNQCHIRRADGAVKIDRADQAVLDDDQHRSVVKPVPVEGMIGANRDPSHHR